MNPSLELLLFKQFLLKKPRELRITLSVFD
jgi:hypothetical protein